MDNNQTGKTAGGFISRTLAVAKGSLIMVLLSFVLLAGIAVVWRGMDLYEASVKAQTVHARIAMERHQIWMDAFRAMKAKENALPPDEAKKLLQEQMNQVPVPHDDAIPAPLPALPKVK